MREPDEQAEVNAKLLGFAELVAETSLSFLIETDDVPAPTLLEQIVAGAALVIPGTVAAAVENIGREGRLQAPIAVGDEVARSVMDAQNAPGKVRAWTRCGTTSRWWWTTWKLTRGGRCLRPGPPTWVSGR